MSSSPPPEQTTSEPADDPRIPPVGQQPAARASATTAQSNNGRRPLTIRSKLIVSIVALITVVCAVIGVTTEIFLRRYLVEQVDKQLAEIHQFAPGGPDRPRAGGTLTNDGLTCADGRSFYGPGQNFGTLTAVIPDDEVTSAGIPAAGANGSTVCNPVPSSADLQLLALPTTDEPQTIDIEGSGEYRVVASTLPGGRVLVNGIPLASVQASLLQLGIIMGVVAGIALLAGGFVVFW